MTDLKREFFELVQTFKESSAETIQDLLQNLNAQAAELEEARKGLEIERSLPKYELTDVKKIFHGTEVTQIRALRDIPEAGVNKNDTGGYVQSRANLGQRGGAWVHPTGIAMDSCIVFDDEQLHTVRSSNINAPQHEH